MIKSSAVLHLSAVFLGLIAFGLSEQAQAGPKFHVIIAADTNDGGLGDALRLDARIMREYFRQEVPEDDLLVKTLTGSSVTEYQVINTIRSLNVGRNDTLVFYFTGHGAFDVQRNDHIMAMDEGKMARSTVRTALQAKNPRLAVLLTDTCSGFGRGLAPRTGVAQSAHSPLFHTLFVQQRGLVDISCTMPGEYGQVTRDEVDGSTDGSYFTLALTAVLGANRTERLSWAQVIYQINQVVKKQWKDSEQTAYAVSPITSNDGRGDNEGGSDGMGSHGITGTLTSASMDHGQRHNGRSGAWITLDYELRNARGKSGFVIIYFNCLTCNDRVNAGRNSRYRDRDGHVWLWREFEPEFDPSYYRGRRFFIPYNELQTSPGHTRMSYDVHLHVMVDGKEVHVGGQNGIEFYINR